MQTIGPKNPSTQNLLVEVDNEIDIQGTTEDNTEFIGNPVAVGGVYLADPTDSPLADGYIGNLLLNDLRMIVAESRAYDPVSDADKQIPVFIPQDRYTFEDLSGTQADSDDTKEFYINMLGYSLFSLQYVEAATSDGYQSLRVFATIEDVADATAATYSDVTSEWFGSANFTADTWLERDTPCSCKYLKIELDLTGLTGGDLSEWKLYLMKKAA